MSGVFKSSRYFLLTKRFFQNFFWNKFNITVPLPYLGTDDDGNRFLYGDLSDTANNPWPRYVYVNHEKCSTEIFVEALLPVLPIRLRVKYFDDISAYGGEVIERKLN